MIHSPAHIAGTGLLTAIGHDTAACFAALRDGNSGIGPAELLSTHWKDELPVGEVKLGNDALAALSGVDPQWPRTALLSAAAVREAWQPFAEAARGLRCGFFSANTVGGMDLTEAFYPAFRQDPGAGSKASFIHHECGAITELVARHFGFRDFATTISTACSSSANSIMMAAQMIEAGLLDIAVAGGADALSRFTLNGFNTLMILDRQPCRPFDGERKGLNLGEGAGYLVLMSEKALAQCNASSLGYVSGYANANDAYHQTASSPEGTGNQLAMRQALAQADLQPSDISYINLHGTGTANNDSSEGKAIESLFGAAVPYASSTKAYTGHTLGAAGGVEAVISTLSLTHGMLFPNLRWQTPMEDVSFRPITELLTGVPVQHILSNSFGFGGNCSSLVFSKS